MALRTTLSEGKGKGLLHEGQPHGRNPDACIQDRLKLKSDQEAEVDGK